MMPLTKAQITGFQDTVWQYYQKNARIMPWREDHQPYYVLVSEIMLQQTQVHRVLGKFKSFINSFPSLHALASAPLGEVLKQWSGLGYNRRAKFLHASAQQIMQKYNGEFPQTLEALVTLPGIGRNTAGAILAYAFNMPVVFIETNIRTVYFYYFFTDEDKISDHQLLKVIEQTFDREHPREWYWALMDYGTHLKTTVGNNIIRSKHYNRQSVFIGSKRQIRGQIIKLLVDQARTQDELQELIIDERLNGVLADLAKEQLVTINGEKVQLAD